MAGTGRRPAGRSTRPAEATAVVGQDESRAVANERLGDVANEAHAEAARRMCGDARLVVGDHVSPEHTCQDGERCAVTVRVGNDQRYAHQAEGDADAAGVDSWLPATTCSVFASHTPNCGLTVMCRDAAVAVKRALSFACSTDANACWRREETTDAYGFVVPREMT